VSLRRKCFGGETSDGGATRSVGRGEERLISGNRSVLSELEIVITGAIVTYLFELEMKL